MLQDRELYNLDKDPLQQDNVIDQYPEVAVKCEHLDVVGDVNDMANEPGRYHRKRPGKSHDAFGLRLAGCVCGPASAGAPWCGENSYWMLEVAEAGEYDFELRRWPRKWMPIYGRTSSHAEEAGWGVPGSLCPREVRIQLGREVQRKSVNPDDTHATFTFSSRKDPYACIRG